MDIVLFKDGSYKFIDSNSYYNKKKKEVKVILIQCVSKVLGEFYTPMTYKKCKTKLESIDFKFKFYKGDHIDEEEMYGSIISFEERYTNVSDLLAKRAEIIYSEDSLNDLFWLHSSFYNNFYDDLKIKVKLKEKNKRVKYSFQKFIKEFIYPDKDLFSESVDIINKKDYGLITRFKDITGNNITLVRVGDLLFIPANSKFISKITNLEVGVDLFLGDEGLELDKMKKKELSDYYWASTGIHNDKNNNFKKNWVKHILEMWCMPMHMYILNNVIYTEDEREYMSVHIKLKCSISLDDKKLKKTDWVEVYNQIFNKSSEKTKKSKATKEIQLVPKGRLAERVGARNGV